MEYLAKLYKSKCDDLQAKIYMLEKLIHEQKMAEDETALDPEFIEKKERRDRQWSSKTEKKIEKIDTKANKETETV